MFSFSSIQKICGTNGALFNNRILYESTSMNIKQKALRLPPKKISQKLILSFTVIMTIVGIISSYIHVKTQEGQLVQTMMAWAAAITSITGAR